jgi:lysophospholipase L1-like esterase
MLTFLFRLGHRRFLQPSIRMKASQFEFLDGTRDDVVFIGDSITEGGLWHEWFADVPVRNRGIGADTSSGVLTRMDTAIANNPRALFLLIGTNDIGLLRVSEADSVGNVRAILELVRERSPETKVHLQSVMPRAAKYADRVRSLNRRYRSLADEFGATWIDLWPTLEGRPGAIRSDYSLDQLHLNGDGYQAWVNVLKPYVSDVRQ